MKPIGYRVSPAFFTLGILVIGAIVFAFTYSLWMLLALPFIVLGFICAAPNLNLANGFFAVVVIIFGLILSYFHRQSGSLIFASTFASWVLSSVEMMLRAKPIYDNKAEQGAAANP